MTEILNSYDIDAYDDTAMVATTEATGEGIEFHVAMKGYTLRDMESLIINAAALQLIGKMETRLAKMIEEKCIELIDDKLTSALGKITTEILDQPITPSFGDKSPVTMREFMGLYGREYLTQHVGSDGSRFKPSSWSSTGTPRIEYLAARVIDSKFKAEIESAQRESIKEVQTSMKKHMQDCISEQKGKFLKALEEYAK
jgi:CRISPR/Cas system-associated endoribonuclease Cas2